MDVSDNVSTYNTFLRASVLKISGTVPLHERLRSPFTLKNLKSEHAIEVISEGERSERDKSRRWEDECND